MMCDCRFCSAAHRLNFKGCNVTSPQWNADFNTGTISIPSRDKVCTMRCQLANQLPACWQLLLMFYATMLAGFQRCVAVAAQYA
jgi:hypothetical protein